MKPLLVYGHKSILAYDNTEGAGIYFGDVTTNIGVELTKGGEWEEVDEWGNTYSTYDPYFSYNAFDQNGSMISKKKQANLGNFYTVLVLWDNGKSMVFVDGEKLTEFDSPDAPSSWIISSFHENGEPFSAIVDNVRVIRRSDIGPSEPEIVEIKVSGGSPKLPVLHIFQQ